MLREIHIYDLDGTVVDSSHRYRTIEAACGSIRIDLPFWRNNSHLAHNDKLLPLAGQLIEQAHNPRYEVIVATARVMGAADWDFMRRHFPLDKILAFCHRPEGSTEKGGPMKAAQIQTVINTFSLHNVSLRWFYEDNLDYLHHVSFEIGAVPVYVPSSQGY